MKKLYVLGIYPKMIESRVFRRYLCTRVHGSVVHSSPEVEGTQVPIER